MTYLNELFWQLPSSFVKELLQILVEEFEDKSKLFVGMKNIYKSDDVGMLQFFEQSDLSNSCTWDTFIL